MGLVVRVGVNSWFSNHPRAFNLIRCSSFGQSGCLLYHRNLVVSQVVEAVFGRLFQLLLFKDLLLVHLLEVLAFAGAQEQAVKQILWRQKSYVNSQMVIP